MITRVAQLTPAALTALLGRRVTAVAYRQIGTGQVGATYRIDLQGEDVPATLVGKFAAPDEFTRATAAAQGSYVRETGFYRDLARPELPIPRMVHVAMDLQTAEFALLMHDLPDHAPGDQLTPLTRGQAEAAVAALATVHRAYWGSPELATLSYLPGSDGHAPAPLEPLYAMLWPAFVERYGVRVSPAMRRVGEAYRGRLEAWAAPRGGVHCLLHGDFRQDNLLFGPDGAVVVVDWQTAAVGCGATDLSYFAGTALAVEDRRQWEQALFERWLAGLDGGSVDREQLWQVYRRDSFAGFLMGVAASMIVGRTERGDAMFLAMCERAAAMVEDHAAAMLF